ncbi:MAG: trans-2-enoyl-CoA reductase family protein [Spirochaetia bacterium]|nr:trans-2-enoyl-CoA reductase family protein [Spirochaetia bacterium]
MIISHKVMRNVSLTAHPVGCKKYVDSHIEFLEKRKGECDSSLFPKRILVIGGSTGYGLSSRIVPSILSGSSTINVSFEREPSEKKTATPGYYMTKSFEKEAKKRKLYAKSIFGDAFSSEIKKDVADIIAQDLGQVDLIVYSLASPMRLDPVTGVMYRSVIKSIGKDYSSLSLDTSSGMVVRESLERASDEQTQETVKVMGGEDWKLWIDYLLSRNVIAKNAITVAYSYIGPEVTYPMYREGTIGKAKEHLEKTSHELQETLSLLGGKAFVSVNKALVTRASSVIPVVPLYISLLYDVMKEKGIHEECIGQMYRLFCDRLYSGKDIEVDEENRIRLDDWEMRSDVQQEVDRRWALQKEGELMKEGDLAGFQKEYQYIHGFGYDGVNYEKDIDPREIP